MTHVRVSPQDKPFSWEEGTLPAEPRAESAGSPDKTPARIPIPKPERAEAKPFVAPPKSAPDNEESGYTPMQERGDTRRWKSGC